MSRAQSPDRCPGLTRPFTADDGLIVRLRAPGGTVPVTTLREIVSAATEFGAPVVQLTSRANLQVRALPDPLPEAFVEALESTGLLPSATHELARTVLGAPLAPVGGVLDRLVTDLDAAVMADPALAELPGRWLWAVDDRDGRVLGEGADAAYQLTGDDDGRLVAAGRSLACRPADAVRGLIDIAHRFLAARPDAGAWNVCDLADPGVVLPGASAPPTTPGAAPEPGLHGDDLVAGVPLGMLVATHVDALARVTDVVRVTPWRSLVVPGAGRADAATALRESGFAVDPGSPWSHLTACVGAPACRRTDTPTLALAREAARSLPPSARRTHVVGCERACGHPRGDHALVLRPDSAVQILDAAGATA